MDKAEVSLAVLIVGGLIGALVLTAGVLYASDYGIQATIVQRNCPNVTAETAIGGFQVTQQVAGVKCQCVDPGDTVVYHIRSGQLEYANTGGGLC